MPTDIRPKDLTDVSTTIRSDDCFPIDSPVSGTRMVQYPGLKTALATDFVASSGTYGITSYFDSFSRIAAQLGGVKFDGVTASQRASAFMGDWNIGTNDFTVSVLLRVPTTPSTVATVWNITSSATVAAAYGMDCYISSAGTIWFEHFKAGTAAANITTYKNTTLGSAYAGKVVLVTLRRLSGVFTCYINDTSLALTETVGASGPAAEDTILGNYFHLGGNSSSVFNDRIIRAALFNYALTAAEVATLYNDGILAEQRWVSYHGGNAILNIERNSTFAAAATDWTAAGTGTPTISAAGAIVFNAADDYVVLAATSVAQLTPGVLHKITFDVSGGTYGGNTATVGYGPSANTVTDTIGTITADGSYNFEFTPKHGLCAFNIIAVGGALNFTIDNVRVTKVLLTNGSFETAGVGGGSTIANNVANGWMGTWSGVGSSVAQDNTVVHSGTYSMKMVTASGGNAQLTAGGLTIGRKYLLKFWAKGNVGSEVVRVVAFTPGTLYETKTITSSWAEYSITPFVAVDTQFSIRRNADSTFWIDDFELIELGALDAWGPAGLDDLTTLWRSDNPSSGHDATLFNLTQRADGTCQNIILGYGRGAGERGNLGRISRESGTMSLGGISLPGNANQRLTISSAPDIATNSFWVRAQFVCPTANPSATQGGLFAIVSAANAVNSANGIVSDISTAGACRFILFGSSSSNYRIVSADNFVSRFGGRVVDVVWLRNAAGSATCWVNGSQVATTETVNGTPPTWAGSVTSTYAHVGVYNTTARFIGEYYRFQVGCGVLTDAMVRQVYNAGIGTGTGSVAGTPISRGGSFTGPTSGVVIDLDLAPGVGGCYYDKSGNGYHAYSNLVDETHKLPKLTGAIKGRLSWTASTTPAEFSASSALVPANAVFTSIVIEPSASSSGTGIKVGNATTADYYVAAVAFTANTKQSLTLANAFPFSGRLRFAVTPDSSNYTGTIDITANYYIME